MASRQLGLFDKNPDCPFEGLFEDDDDRCYSLSGKNNYDEISEDRPDLEEWLAEIGGVRFDNVTASNTPAIDLPSFLPTIPRGGKKLTFETDEKFFGITLRDVVSMKQLKVAVDIRATLGLAPDTKLVLLAYGRDELIENIWPERWRIYEELLKLNLDLITSINYSIWLNQNHCEHLINVKRNLLTFQEMQSIGLPAIPSIYWYGHKDLDRWAKWLNDHPQIKMAAINLQTLRTRKYWTATVDDLTYFSKLLKSEIHFLIDGPSTIGRIDQIKEIFFMVTITNKYCANMAATGMELSHETGKILSHYSPVPRNIIFKKNTNLYGKLTGKGSNLNVPHQSVSI